MLAQRWMFSAYASASRSHSRTLRVWERAARMMTTESSSPATSSTCYPTAVRPGTPGKPSIHDPPVVRRPGEIVEIRTLIRNWWSFPAVGFNSILEIPVRKFELWEGETEDPQPIIVPNDVFGVPIRKDIIYKVYWFHRRALMGFDETMQMYEWEFPGSNRKVRPGQRSGKARIGRRKAPGRYEGVFAFPIRPRDWRQKQLHRLIWKATKCMLSAKFAQGEIIVVDSFNVSSHKTKHSVQFLRRILGTKCNSAMLVHEGTRDVNDNFRWATAHVAAVKRENVLSVNVWNLCKYRYLVITEKALHKLIYEMHDFPRKRGWGPKNATPDGKKAPVPEKVPGWNTEWKEKKERIRLSEFRAKEYYQEGKKWKWATTLKGPLKIPREDALAGFRVKDVSLRPKVFGWEKLEDLYVDDEPVDDDLEYSNVAPNMETPAPWIEDKQELIDLQAHYAEEESQAHLEDDCRVRVEDDGAAAEESDDE